MSERPLRTGTAVSRRRTIAILAGVVGIGAGLPLLAAAGVGGAGRGRPPLVRWRGAALGAEAEIVLGHPRPEAAQRVLAACLDEIDRLERVFSLHRADSELARLNRAGRLERPSLDLLALLAEARRLSALSGGAFCVTIQPLWRLYAQHFAEVGATGGPPRRQVERALALVGDAGLEATPREAAFRRPGMAVTLNGIAQGYITDRVADLLRDQGLDQVLVELGETRALGGHPGGRDWRIGVADPAAPGRALRTIELRDRAVASSGGYGSRFEPSGRYHHLLDPASGDSARRWAGVTVLAERATLADGLSTALSVMPPERAPALLAAVPGARALFIDADGRVLAPPHGPA